MTEPITQIYIEAIGRNDTVEAVENFIAPFAAKYGPNYQVILSSKSQVAKQVIERAKFNVKYQQKCNGPDIKVADIRATSCYLKDGLIMFVSSLFAAETKPMQAADEIKPAEVGETKPTQAADEIKPAEVAETKPTQAADEIKPAEVAEQPRHVSFGDAQIVSATDVAAEVEPFADIDLPELPPPKETIIPVEEDPALIGAEATKLSILKQIGIIDIPMSLQKPPTTVTINVAGGSEHMSMQIVEKLIAPLCRDTINVLFINETPNVEARQKLASWCGARGYNLIIIEIAFDYRVIKVPGRNFLLLVESLPIFEKIDRAIELFMSPPHNLAEHIFYFIKARPKAGIVFCERAYNRGRMSDKVALFRTSYNGSLESGCANYYIYPDVVLAEST